MAIYIAGSSAFDGWRGNEASILSTGTNTPGNQNNATAIFVTKDHEVYIAGHTPTGAKYWKNGKEHNYGKTNAWMTSGIIVHRGDVYVSGYNGYWKNNTWHELSVDGAEDIEVKSVFVIKRD